MSDAPFHDQYGAEPAEAPGAFRPKSPSGGPRDAVTPLDRALVIVGQDVDRWGLVILMYEHRALHLPGGKGAAAESVLADVEAGRI